MCDHITVFLVLFSKVNVLLMHKCSAFMFILQIALAINIISLSFRPCNFMYISRNAKVLILYLFMVSKRPTKRTVSAAEIENVCPGGCHFVTDH